METMFQRMQDAVPSDQYEDFGLTVRGVISALREPTGAVFAAGITPGQWRAAIDQMIREADQAIEKDFADEVAHWRVVWPGLRAEMESGGAVVQQADRHGDLWDISIHGSPSLATVSLSHRWIDARFYSAGIDSLEDLPRIVIAQIQMRDRSAAERARLRRIKTTHYYERGFWKPRNGLSEPVPIRGRTVDQIDRDIAEATGIPA